MEWFFQPEEESSSAAQSYVDDASNDVESGENKSYQSLLML